MSVFECAPAASDSAVAPYADDYFENDSQQRVTEAVVQGAGCSSCSGGQGTYTYSYTTSSSNAPDFNSWAVKTVETLPDGNQNTVYTNAFGEVMLEAYKDTTTTQTWDTFTQYNEMGQVVLTAAPSAVTGYDDTYADLLRNTGGSYAYLSNHSGLITTIDYYTSTTATSSSAGGVAGYYEDTKIQQGQTGTPILQQTDQYDTVMAGTHTVTPLASATVYRNTGGTGAESTSFAYTWLSRNEGE